MRDIPESPYASMSRGDLEERAKQPNPYRRESRGDDLSWEAVYCGRLDLLSGHRELLPLLGNAAFGKSVFSRMVKELRTFDDTIYCLREVLAHKRPGMMMDALIEKAVQFGVCIDHAQELYNVCSKRNRQRAVSVACAVAPDKATLVSFLTANEIA